MTWDNKQLHWHLNTRRFGRQTRCFDELDSTNQWLMQHPDAFTLSGGVVIADHQLKGRGRNARAWSDSRGGALLFSLFLKFRNDQPYKGFLSILPAIALARVIKKHDPDLDVSLKWPNDVLLAHKKVAGILAESTSHEAQDVVIIGVGVNVTKIPTERFAWPATSVHDHSKWRPGREVLLAELLNEWEPLFDVFLSGELDQLRAAWEEYGPPRGSRVKRVDAQQTIEGEFEGLGAAGQLMLRDKTGTLLEIFSGDVLPA